MVTNSKACTLPFRPAARPGEPTKERPTACLRTFAKRGKSLPDSAWTCHSDLAHALNNLCNNLKELSHRLGKLLTKVSLTLTPQP